MKKDAPARNEISARIDAVLGPSVEGGRYPFAGIAKLTDGRYFANVNGMLQLDLIVKHKAKRGRPLADEAHFRRYAATLAALIDAERNPSISGIQKARISAGRATGKSGDPVDIERSMRADEHKLNPRPMVEIVIQAGKYADVMLFTETPTVQLDAERVHFAGIGWRYSTKSGQCTFSEMMCSIKMSTGRVDPSDPMIERIRKGEPVVISITGLHRKRGG